MSGAPSPGPWNQESRIRASVLHRILATGGIFWFELFVCTLIFNQKDEYKILAGYSMIFANF